MLYSWTKITKNNKQGNGDILYIGEDINVDDGVVFRWWAWRHWACAKQGQGAWPETERRVQAFQGEYRPPSNEEKRFGRSTMKSTEETVQTTEDK